LKEEQILKEKRAGWKKMVAKNRVLSRLLEERKAKLTKSLLSEKIEREGNKRELRKLTVALADKLKKNKSLKQSVKVLSKKLQEERTHQQRESRALEGVKLDIGKVKARRLTLMHKMLMAERRIKKLSEERRKNQQRFSLVLKGVRWSLHKKRERAKVLGLELERLTKAYAKERRQGDRNAMEWKKELRKLEAKVLRERAKRKKLSLLLITSKTLEQKKKKKLNKLERAKVLGLELERLTKAYAKERRQGDRNAMEWKKELRKLEAKVLRERAKRKKLSLHLITSKTLEQQKKKKLNKLERQAEELRRKWKMEESAWVDRSRRRQIAFDAELHKVAKQVQRMRDELKRKKALMTRKLRANSRVEKETLKFEIKRMHSRVQAAKMRRDILVRKLAEAERMQKNAQKRRNTLAQAHRQLLAQIRKEKEAYTSEKAKSAGKMRVLRQHYRRKLIILRRRIDRLRASLSSTKIKNAKTIMFAKAGWERAINRRRMKLAKKLLHARRLLLQKKLAMETEERKRKQEREAALAKEKYERTKLSMRQVAERRHERTIEKDLQKKLERAKAKRVREAKEFKRWKNAIEVRLKRARFDNERALQRGGLKVKKLKTLLHRIMDKKQKLEAKIQHLNRRRKYEENTMREVGRASASLRASLAKSRKILMKLIRKESRFTHKLRRERERNNKQKARNAALSRRIVGWKKTLKQRQIEYEKKIKKLALEKKKENQLRALERRLMKKFRHAAEEERESTKKNQDERQRLRDQKARRHGQEKIIVSLARQISLEKSVLNTMKTKVKGQRQKTAKLRHEEKQAERALKRMVVKQTRLSAKLRTAWQSRNKLIGTLRQEKSRLVKIRRLYVKYLHSWHSNTDKLKKLKSIVLMLSEKVRRADEKYQKELKEEKLWEAKERAIAANKKNRLLRELTEEQVKISQLKEKIKKANQKHFRWRMELEKLEATHRANLRAMKRLKKHLWKVTRRNKDMRRNLLGGPCSVYEKWHEIRRKEESLVRTLLGKREQVRQLYGKVRKANEEIRDLIRRLGMKTAKRRRKDLAEKLLLVRKEHVLFELKRRLRAQRRAELATSKYLTQRI